MRKFLLSLLIIFSAFNSSITYASQKQIYSHHIYNSRITSIYLQNIFLIGDNHIAFLLPSTYKFKYVHPFSLVSPSGEQLINIVPQFIDILQPIIRIYLRRPLEEKGAYKIIFTGIEEKTNQEVDILGEFYYR